ncbi:UDP-N-acetylmuramoyl-tripeptide--D-alanyl-D-alanine ligase [Noviherbaspirillum autotrophicum]|uniref:UDP-N-acetylmuramoyl-tripeptide--D-alanyl-D-alanine ligase n=1 Tax=Noviherbaspirillum autotrophicum TaxID=709839 RepID=A0A0C2BV85_9BURK|nr:UDP-N-acetylmuramoyl-tripeptide--D-alanyl-D-alanine ligase [Noviherbaspirillum autotrophicum]KIF81931.1 UDP-N-acetylmuramoyl-tripeptide--D-alanyl-D-alanine ligase [Noviherbaspirillum autotrophicum]
MKSSLAALQPWISRAAIANVSDSAADAKFDGVSTDSRAVSIGNLFVALRGERFDAHDFLNEVAAKGVAAMVVERVPEGLAIPALVVPDTRVALGEIAAYWRRQFALPVIGVTGSNGKTTVKEMIASILAAAFGAERCMATRGNLNNDIGVPLTVFRLNASYQAAVIELGMNHPGEIAQLAAIAQPTVGLVNNAQREHQEFMESVEAVARENGAVLRSLPENGTAVFPADDEYTPLWRDFAAGRKVKTFGLSDDADVTCAWQANDFGSDLSIRAGTATFQVKLAAAGEHNVCNALAATACTLAVGVPVDAVIRGLEAFAPVNGRLQRKAARCGALVIDDTYNANPDSVRAAIDVLANAAKPRLLVLGDMGEVGNEGPQYHAEVGAYAKSRGIEHMLALGDLARHSVEAFGADAEHFADVATLNAAVDKLASAGSTVLVKGSRFMEMERVVQHLVNQESSVQEAH